MKIVGLMPWYDEPAATLWESIATLSPHIDDLIAVDGAYADYPGGRNESPAEQHEAIRDACAAGGLHKYEIITPGRVWQGNEIEKRSYLFEYAEHRTTPADWYIIWDSDMILTRCEHLREDLDATSLDSASFLLVGNEASREPPLLVHRMAHRAIRGLTVIGSHSVFGYLREGGWRYVWGHTSAPPALDLSDSVVVEHHPENRSPDRNARKIAYDNAAARMEAA